MTAASFLNLKTLAILALLAFVIDTVAGAVWQADGTHHPQQGQPLGWRLWDQRFPDGWPAFCQDGIGRRPFQFHPDARNGIQYRGAAGERDCRRAAARFGDGHPLMVFCFFTAACKGGFFFSEGISFLNSSRNQGHQFRLFSRAGEIGLVANRARRTLASPARIAGQRSACRRESSSLRTCLKERPSPTRTPPQPLPLQQTTVPALDIIEKHKFRALERRKHGAKIIGYIQLVWTCDHCGTQNPGAIKSCTSRRSSPTSDVQFTRWTRKLLISSRTKP